MIIYIAFLRGINVGGKNIIKMIDLRQAFESLELCEVKTYIQSGNVLFKSDEEEENLIKKIEDRIKEVFGFSINVILRNASEIVEIIQNCPFSEESILKASSTCEGESLYVSLLSDLPSKEKINCLDIYKSENDDFVIKGREVFLLFHKSIRNSKLANNLQKIHASSTVRNWKTMNKLAMLAKEMNTDLSIV